MTETETVPAPAGSIEELHKVWQELSLRVEQLDAKRAALEEENRALRKLVERSIEHRQKSHNELVLLLTALVSKLPINDIGVVVSKLVEHNTNVTQYLAALIKGTAEMNVPEPVLLKTWEQTKRELAAAVKPIVEELLRLDPPFEPDLLQSLAAKPETFFSPNAVRANRCFVKGQVPRERVVREFGEEALVFFQDMTTDPKLNPRPKPGEIVMAFRSDFEALFQQNPGLLPGKREQLLDLYQRVQRSKAPTDQARQQKIAFQKLSFLVDLLHYYENQNTEPVDVVFAQRLPALLEQLVFAAGRDELDEKLLLMAESLLSHVINPDHRLMIVNNIGKGAVTGKTVKFVLRLRMEKVPDLDQVIADFIRHLIPAPPQKPSADAIASVLRFLKPETQRLVVRAIMGYDRIPKHQAEALGKATGEVLGLKALAEEIRAQEAIPPEIERQLAWAKIKDLIARRTDPTAIAAAIRGRLNAKYDGEEVRQSWITLTEADPLAFIKIFCQMPYLANGKTDSIARTVMETYVTRLTHEKYATTYRKIINSLKSMFHAKPDSPTLVNFIALVKWVDSDAASRICHDIGMPAVG